MAAARASKAAAWWNTSYNCTNVPEYEISVQPRKQNGGDEGNATAFHTINYRVDRWNSYKAPNSKTRT